MTSMRLKLVRKASLFTTATWLLACGPGVAQIVEEGQEGDPVPLSPLPVPASPMFPPSAAIPAASRPMEQGSAERCIAIVRTDAGSGTGFLYKMGNETYLVSNSHVLENAQRFEFRLVDGTLLKPLKMELADDRDLVRVRLADTNTPALAPATEIAIGSPVVVMGNSQGMNAVTRLTGAVTGLGPQVVEVSTPFVEGNSGSPIMDSNGRVIGVATFVVRPDPDDWVARGTPFGKPRRFGVRLSPDIRWVPLSVRDFHAQSSLLNDVGSFLRESMQLLGALQGDDLQMAARIQAVQQGVRQSYRDPAYARAIDQFCNQFLSAVQNAYGTRYSAKSSAVKAPIEQARLAFRNLPELPLANLKKARWSTQFLRSRADDLQKILEQWKARLGP